MKKKPNVSKGARRANDLRGLLFLVMVVAIVVGFMEVLSDRSGLTPVERGIARVIEGVVHIGNVTVGCQGSGFLVSPNVVVTARHVIKDGTDFEVTLNDGRTFRSSVALMSRKYDVGFLLLDDRAGPTVSVGSIEDCRLGQSVFAIGSPFGRLNMNSVTLGIISRLHCDFSKVPGAVTEDYGWPKVTFQTDANGEPGNSGCPVFSLDGVVRGILVGGCSNGIIYCVPSDVFMDELRTVRALFRQSQFEYVRLPEPRLPVAILVPSDSPQSPDEPNTPPAAPEDPNEDPNAVQ